MKILYLDCFLGFDTQMLLGALISMGAEIEALNSEIQCICPDGRIITEHTSRCSVEAEKAFITAPRLNGEMTENQTMEFISTLSSDSSTLSFLRRICECFWNGAKRAPVNIKSVNRDEFTLQMASACAVKHALNQLGAEYVICSALKNGCGFSPGTNALIPSPVTMEILLSLSVPFKGTELGEELISPWSAAALGGIVNEYGCIPEMDICKIGYGAGEKELPIPNLIRAVLGTQRGGDVAEMLTEADMFSEISDEIFTF